MNVVPIADDEYDEGDGNESSTPGLQEYNSLDDKGINYKDDDDAESALSPLWKTWRTRPRTTTTVRPALAGVGD